MDTTEQLSTHECIGYNSRCLIYNSLLNCLFLASCLAPFLVLSIPLFIGVESVRPSILQPLLQTNVQNSQSVGLLLAMTVVPLAFMLISYFIYKAKYKLDEPEYDRICQELVTRRASVK